MANKNSKPIRIDKELEDMLKEISIKNDISMRQASKELARASKTKLKGNSITKEIKF